MSDQALEVIGTPPRLEQQVCRQLLFEQYWHGGELVDPANVVYLRFGEPWHRLTFDHGIIFWRQHAEPPASYEMPELEGRTQIDNVGARLGLEGLCLVSYAARKVAGGSEVAFTFDDGRTLVVRNVSDHTSWTVV